MDPGAFEIVVRIEQRGKRVFSQRIAGIGGGLDLPQRADLRDRAVAERARLVGRDLRGGKRP
jgi:hypothetical protein